MVGGKYWGGNIEDVRFTIDGEEKPPLKAFNQLYSGMYGLNEWYNNPDTKNLGERTKKLGDDIGLRYLPPELRADARHWLKTKDNPNAEIEIDRVTGSGVVEEKYDVELRSEENPRNTKTPFSVLAGIPKQNTDRRIGVRVLRDYDPEILLRSDYVDPETHVEDLTSGATLSGEEIDFDFQQDCRATDGSKDLSNLGWLNEPYLQAAFDRKEGVDWRLAKDEDLSFLRPVNPEKHVYIDTDRSPEYDKSNLDVMMLYQWMEGLGEGLSFRSDEAFEIGRHTATLHSLNLVNWDRSTDELFADISPERGERIVVENDYEFGLWTTREDLKDEDSESVKRQAVELLENTRDEVTLEEERSIIEDVDEGYNHVMSEMEANPELTEELEYLIIDNIPERWHPNIFEERFLVD